jgi:spoIIIJ-associated protein
MKKSPAKKNKKDTKELLTKLTKELFKHLEVSVKTTISKDKEGVFKVQLEAEDPGILIGYHGETLASLQLILAMMVYRHSGEWARVLVNVGDYRERRQESLEKMALSAAQKVKFSGEPQPLPYMNSAERRLIHLALSSDDEVVTESEGEGYRRRVVVKPA